MKPEGEVWLNIGSGIHLLSDFINIDNFFTLEDCQKAEGIYCNARIEPGAEFVKADACNLPFPDDYADYILADCMIEHLEMVDVIPALWEWRRVLKPAGELVVTTTDFNELASLWMSHIVGQPYDLKMYHVLSEIIYGNQAGGRGEYHCTPFNIDHMKHCLVAAGWPYFSIGYYPTNAKPYDIRGYPPRPPEKQFLISSMLYVSARKVKPDVIPDNTITLEGVA